MFKKIKYLIVLIILILLFTTCNESETLNLVNASITTCNLVSEYYEKLIVYTIETWEMEAFNSSLRGVSFPFEEQDEYQKTIDHLKARKKMVDSVGKIYSSLEKFVNNKTSEEVKETATELGNNINELKPLKDSSIVMPSDIFGNFSQDIFDMYKFFEIKHITKTMSTMLGKIKTLYEKESELYTAIIDERNNKSLYIINYLIDNEMVVPWSLIESAPATIGLEMAVAKKPAKDFKTKQAIKKVLEVKYYRMKYLTKSAESEINTLLLNMIKSHNEFIEGKKVAFDNISYITKKVVGYFNDINEYVETIRNKGTDNASTEPDIIYRGNTDSKIFHQPNCPYYYSENSTVIFKTREEAIKAGYRPCKTCKP